MSKKFSRQKKCARGGQAYYYPVLVRIPKIIWEMSDTRKRAWIFTINNYTEADHKELELLATEATWLCYGEEIAPTTLTPHIQGCLYMPIGKSIKYMKKLLTRAHLAVMNGKFKRNEEYCSKGENVRNIGIRPLDPKEKGDKEQGRWKEIWDAASEGRLDDIPPRERIVHYNVLNQIASDRRAPMTQLTESLHEWLVGPPGTGKSWAARAENPVLYLKNSNKWWCGYNLEEVVLIEELELDAGKFMGHFLKIWADIYPFTGEVKHGKTSIIRPKKIIVTSNYSIGQIFGHDPVIAQAILRRFNVRQFLIKYQ